MSFYKLLQQATTKERQELLQCQLVNDALNGNMTLNQYVAFLNQAYHHVSHTTPLLMAAGSRICSSQEWLRDALAQYVQEELGHQEWILNDIEACGYDSEKARHSTPNRATELMIAYAYHIIDRVNPIGFFAMVHVLEGTSIKVADQAASGIAQSTGLPSNAFSYLRSHGALDIEHVAFFEKLMDRIEDKNDQQFIIHCAKNFYHLYADVYRSVEASQALSIAA